MCMHTSMHARPPELPLQGHPTYKFEVDPPVPPPPHTVMHMRMEPHTVMRIATCIMQPRHTQSPAKWTAVNTTPHHAYSSTHATPYHAYSTHTQPKTMLTEPHMG